jgi:hypothetical protein
VPHDAVIPEALTMGDLSDVAAALAPRPLRMEGLVDGVNHEVSADLLARTMEPTRSAYNSAGAESRLQLGAGGDPGHLTAARWLLRGLQAASVK